MGCPPGIPCGGRVRKKSVRNPPAEKVANYNGEKQTPDWDQNAPLPLTILIPASLAALTGMNRRAYLDKGTPVPVPIIDWMQKDRRYSGWLVPKEESEEESEEKKTPRTSPVVEETEEETSGSEEDKKKDSPSVAKKTEGQSGTDGPVKKTRRRKASS